VSGYLIGPESTATARFTLRSWRPGDGAALQEASTSSFEHLAPWMPWASQHQTVEQAEVLCRQFRGRYLLATDFVLGVFGPAERVLGGTGFHLREGPLASRCAEIGMWIRASEAGTGLGTAVLQEMLHWGFTDWPWERLSWRCRADNRASRRVAEKAGMEQEGILRNQWSEGFDARRDTVVYAALRDGHAR